MNRYIIFVDSILKLSVGENINYVTAGHLGPAVIICYLIHNCKMIIFI